MEEHAIHRSERRLHLHHRDSRSFDARERYESPRNMARVSGNNTVSNFPHACSAPFTFVAASIVAQIIHAAIATLPCKG